MSRDWRDLKSGGEMTLRGFLAVGCACAFIVCVVLAIADKSLSFMEQVKAVLPYLPFVFCSWAGAFILLALAARGLV